MRACAVGPQLSAREGLTALAAAQRLVQAGADLDAQDNVSRTTGGSPRTEIGAV